MKNLKSISAIVQDSSDPYELLADAERHGEISIRTFFRACAAGDGLTESEAADVLRENYQRAGVAHLCPI